MYNSPQRTLPSPEEISLHSDSSLTEEDDGNDVGHVRFARSALRNVDCLLDWAVACCSELRHCHVHHASVW